MTDCERAEDGGAAPEDGGAHARWCVALAERADLGLTGPEQLAWLDRLEDEQDHLRVALAWTISEGEVELALRLSGALTQFWQIRGHFTEGLGWLRGALALDGAAALPACRARALWGVGFMSLMLGDLATSVSALDQSLVLAVALDDAQLQARSLLLSGNGWMFADRPRAIDLLTRSAALARAVGDGWCRALALSLRARTHLVLGEAETALPLMEECLAVARANGDQQTLCVGLTVRGGHAMDGPDDDLAREVLAENLRVARRLGEPCLLVLALMRSGQLSLRSGDHERSRELLAEALARDGEAEGARQEAEIQRSIEELELAGRRPGAPQHQPGRRISYITGQSLPVTSRRSAAGS